MNEDVDCAPHMTIGVIKLQLHMIFRVPLFVYSGHSQPLWQVVKSVVAEYRRTLRKQQKHQTEGVSKAQTKPSTNRQTQDVKQYTLSEWLELKLNNWDDEEPTTDPGDRDQTLSRAKNHDAVLQIPSGRRYTKTDKSSSYEYVSTPGSRHSGLVKFNAADYYRRTETHYGKATNISTVARGKALVSSKKGDKKIRKATVNFPALFIHHVYKLGPRDVATDSFKVHSHGIELSFGLINPLKTDKPRIQRKIGEKKTHKAKISQFDVKIGAPRREQRFTFQQHRKRARSKDVDPYTTISDDAATPKESSDMQGRGSIDYAAHRDFIMDDSTYRVRKLRQGSVKGGPLEDVYEEIKDFNRPEDYKKFLQTRQHRSSMKGGTLENVYEEIKDFNRPEDKKLLQSNQPRYRLDFKKRPERENTYITLVIDSNHQQGSRIMGHQSSSENRKSATSQGTVIVPDMVVLKGGHVVQPSDKKEFKSVLSNHSVAYANVGKPMAKHPYPDNRSTPLLPKRSEDSTVYSAAPPLPPKAFPQFTYQFM